MFTCFDSSGHGFGFLWEFAVFVFLVPVPVWRDVTLLFEVWLRFCLYCMYVYMRVVAVDKIPSDAIALIGLGLPNRDPE